MDLVKRSIGISKTFKNVARLREILSVLASNGLDEIIQRSETLKRLPGFVLPKAKKITDPEYAALSEWPGILGFRLRKSFEELGSSFIKIGQLLATREDTFPPGFIDQMKKLQSNVKPLPFPEVKEVIEKSLGDKLEIFFKEIDEKPIGTASIGVVHKAVLKTGEDVVVKVRRPGIGDKITVDFELVRFVIENIEKVSDEVKYLGISKVVKDFEISLKQELDFKYEEQNLERIQNNVEKHDKKKVFYFPKVYKEISTKEVLVLELLKGIPFNDEAGIEPYKEELHGKLIYGLECFVKTILKDGFFHADLHGGNFFYLPEQKRIGLIDFGLVGNMSRKSRNHFVAILYSLLSNNYENLVYEFLDVAEYDEIPDVDSLIIDVKDNISPFVGLTAQNINFPALFRAIVRTLTGHKVYLPRDWFIVFRALITMDGVSKSLDMDFDLFAIIDENLDEILEGFISKDNLMEESAWVARDLLSVSRVLPRHLRWFLKDYAKKGYTLEFRNKELSQKLGNLNQTFIFIALSLVASVFFVIGSFFLSPEASYTFRTFPTISYVFYLTGLVLFLYGFRKIK